jgi:hypothetical protein
MLTTQAMNDWLLNVDARVMDAVTLAKKRDFCSPGDAVVVVTGWVTFFSFQNFLFNLIFHFFQRPGYGSTNTLRIIYAD